MREAPPLLFGALCLILFCATAYAAGDGPLHTTLGCAVSTLTGPNYVQIEDFRAKLSDPKALKTFFDYHYSASLISDGLSNGTKPVYVLPMPRFIVTPNVPEDVVKTVQFAADYGLKVQALGTGHQLSGVALPECGITINMKNLNKLDYDSTTYLATVQMGVTSGYVAQELLQTLSVGRLPSIGTCKYVGVAGFALQGGLGYILRYHGTASDFIQSMDVVTVGEDKKAIRRTIDAQNEPDLFFGFRGAGGALGVAISYSTHTFEVPPNVQTATYTFDLDIGADVLTWFAEFVSTAPLQVYFSATLLPATSNPAGPAILEVDAYNIGPGSADIDAVFEKLRAYALPKALSNGQQGNLYNEVDYYTFSVLPKECGNLKAATYWNTYFTPDNTVSRGILPIELINTMIAQIKASPFSTIAYSLIAGASVPSGADAQYYTPNAWSFRDSYYIFIGDTWTSKGPTDDAAHIAYVKASSEVIKPYIVGNYFNQLMFEAPKDAELSYSAENFAKLEVIKAQYDPHNLFRDLHYTHPYTVPNPDLLTDVYDSSPFDALAPAPGADMHAASALAPNMAVSAAEAPQPVQG